MTIHCNYYRLSPFSSAQRWRCPSVCRVSRTSLRHHRRLPHSGVLHIWWDSRDISIFYFLASLSFAGNIWSPHLGKAYSSRKSSATHSCPALPILLPIPVLRYPFLPCPTHSCPALPIQSCPALTIPALRYPSCYPFLPCATHSCPVLPIPALCYPFLPVLGIFNVYTVVEACDCTRGLYEHLKRVCTESWLKEREKTCRTVDSNPQAYGSHALPTDRSCSIKPVRH